MQRVGEILSRLKALNETKRLLEPWHEDMLHHFAGELGFSHLRLTSYRHDWLNLPTIALAARSTLELSVWIFYCCKSTLNARRFFEDKFRDGAGFYDAMKRFMRCVPGGHQADSRIEEFKTVLDDLAMAVGAGSSQTEYTKVLAAAKEVAGREYFASLNAVLSKFVHPTSMVVLNYLTRECDGSLDGLAVFFKFIGVSQEIAGWAAIGAFINGLGIGPQAVD